MASRALAAPDVRARGPCESRVSPARASTLHTCLVPNSQPPKGPKGDKSLLEPSLLSVSGVRNSDCVEISRTMKLKSPKTTFLLWAPAIVAAVRRIPGEDRKWCQHPDALRPDLAAPPPSPPSLYFQPALVTCFPQNISLDVKAKAWNLTVVSVSWLGESRVILKARI